MGGGIGRVAVLGGRRYWEGGIEGDDCTSNPVSAVKNTNVVPQISHYSTHSAMTAYVVLVFYNTTFMKKHKRIHKTFIKHS